MGQTIIKNACFQDRNNFDIIQGRKFDSIVKFNHDVLSQYSNFDPLFFADFFSRTWLTLKLEYTVTALFRIKLSKDSYSTKIEDSLELRNKWNKLDVVRLLRIFFACKTIRMKVKMLKFILETEKNI